MNTFVFIGVIAVAIFGLVQAQNDISEAMEKFNIVDDVVDDGAMQTLSVNFDSGVSANKGNELTPTQVKNAPELDWEADNNKFYTLIMTDPDAKDPYFNSYTEYVPWLVVNIPGKDIKSGQVIADYVGSGAPKGTGLHRYIFVVFEQNGKQEFDEEPIPKNNFIDHAYFSTRDFAKKHQLGAPLAVNFFLAQFDEQSNKVREMYGYDAE